MNAKDDIVEEGERIENENFIGADEHADSRQNVMIQNGKGISTQSSVHDTIYSIRNVMILYYIHFDSIVMIVYTLS